MLPRKKRKNIVIVSIIIILLAIIGVIVYLYMTTDAFKSNDTLFIKYLSQNFDIIEELQNQNGMKEANELLENNKFTSSIQGKIKYTVNKGFEDEKTDNPINNIELNIQGQTDKSDNYEYKDVKIVKQDQNLVRAEYIKENDKNGIRLDGIKQFAFLDESVQEDVDILSTIENITEMDFSKIKRLFTKEEVSELLNKCLTIIINNTNKQEYSKTANCNITINDSSVKANAYEMALTKEQFNNIYIQILEEAKQNEIILSKIDELNSQIKKMFNVDKGLKQVYIDYLANLIETIKNTNIGQQQRTVTVFEKNGQTIRTQIISDEYEFNIDRLTNENGIWIELYYLQKTQKENSWKINGIVSNTENEENDYLGIKFVKNGSSSNVEINNVSKMKNNIIDSQCEVRAYTEKNEALLTIQKKDTIVNSFKDKIELNEENYIDLNSLEQEQKNNSIQIIKANIQEQLNKLEQEIALQDTINMMVSVGLMKESMAQINEGGIVTEAEKNRFNAMFEFYQGDELEKESIQKMMDVVKNNLKEIKIMEYEEKTSSKEEPKPIKYLIIIEKDKQNEDLANLLLENLNSDKNRNDKYSVSIEYDENNGLVKNIILSIV